MGIRLQAGIGWSIVLHTLAWDNRTRDYNFFGYVVTPQSRGEVKQDWTAAPDRHENRDVLFIDVGNKTQCLNLVEQMARQRTEWSSEAIICTLRSLLYFRKVAPEDLVRIFGSWAAP